MPGGRELRKNPRGPEKTCKCPKKIHWYILSNKYKVPLRDLGGVKSRGCRKLKSDMQVPQAVAAYVGGNMHGLLCCFKKWVVG